MASLFTLMPRILILMAPIVATGAAAQGTREGDLTMSVSELEGVLVGQEVEFFDGSKARYLRDRAYSYTYQEGDAPFVGVYPLRDDSRVCVEFENGFSRCDTYVRAGDRLVLIIEDGTRFPVRSVVPLAD